MSEIFEETISKGIHHLIKKSTYLEVSGSDYLQDPQEFILLFLIEDIRDFVDEGFFDERESRSNILSGD